MDGYYLAQAIRQIEDNEARPTNISIIGWTANAFPQEVERCEAASMNALLIKPTKMMQLKTTLEEWLPISTLAINSTFNNPKHKKSGDTQAPIDTAELAKVALSTADKINILQDFMAQTRSDFDELEATLNQQDFAACMRIAHRMKGSSRMVGASKLALSCEAMEKAAHQSNTEGLGAAKVILDQALEQLEVHIFKEIAANGR